MAVAPAHHDDPPRVLELLYRQHASALRAYCRRRVGADDADEVVQTTFLRAFGALNRGERPHAERAWLLTIARNVCASRATSAMRRHELLDPRALDTATAPSVPDDDDVELEAALRALPDGQRRAFVLRAVHELSYEEIAAELDVTRAAVESWIFRARRKLADAVGERRRRLALDLSSAAGAAKSLVAANVLKVAAVSAAAGTAFALGPAAPDRAAQPRASRVSAPRQATTLPRERERKPELRRERAPGAREAVAPAEARRPGEPVAAAVPRPPTAAPPAEDDPPVDAARAADAPAPAESSGVEIAVPDVPLLEEPALALPAVDPPELAPLPPPVLPAVDPTAVLPVLPELP